MNLTPQQRLAAYEWAREMVDRRRVSPFVCHILIEWVEQNHPECEQKNDIKLFPEFLAQKPDSVTNPNTKWWDFRPNGTITRLAALDRAIELVKKEI